MLIRKKNLSILDWARASVVGFAVAFGALGFATNQARASDQGVLCDASYYNGIRPQIVNERLAKSTVELCHDYHATLYSGIALSPLWSGAFLTKGRIIAGKQVNRSNDFREDERLPQSWRSTLQDYRGSGFDRGHLVPSADMPTPKSDSESFLLSNIVPQNPQLNRNLWAAIEAAVRAHAMHRPVYTITGALFIGSTVERLNGRVMIPSHLYKVVYEPERNAASAYLVPNAPDRRHQEVDLPSLEALAGIRFFPGVENISSLKLPRPRYGR